MEKAKAKATGTRKAPASAMVLVDTPKDADVKTIGEGAYAKLRSDLIAGRIAPGTRLPFRQLSARYKVGIGPLREALVRLSSEHLVAFEGQRGFMAAPLSMDDLNDLCGLRIDLSCRALRDSIERGGEDWEDEILVALHRMERSPLPTSFDDDDSIDEWERRHDRFHTSLIAACGSRWLLHFCATLSDQFQRYRRFTVLRMAQSYSLFDAVRSQHRAMAEAALERRADDAVAMLKTHYEGSLTNVTEQMESFVNRRRA
ncbi:FCD domain-containing protein [Aquabacter sp. CN5-332]|uniref:FCD domain-containing protein n=1 Tax=Aquabacter sp. CN5-332 TaxID=3156608 RepID=UPI0032B3AB51